MTSSVISLARRALATTALALVATADASAQSAVRDPLPSWRDGPTKRAILALIRQSVRQGTPDLLPPAERVAVFDNDGTLWVEQPLYTQFAFAIDRLKEMAQRDPALAQRQPFKAAIEGDMRTVMGSGEKGLAEIVAVTHAGMSQEAFTGLVTQWLATARHPRFNRPYTQLIYQPMLEVMRLLRREGFAVWIVTGGGQEFVRAFSAATYDVALDRVVGSVGKTEFRLLPDGKSELFRLPAIDALDDGPGKPIGIGRFIGRRPAIAFGNSDGDIEMLQYTTTAPGRRLGLLVHHDDAAREFAYDRESHIGKLDRGLTMAPQAGWQVISMRNDWSRIFA
ncbi:HAD family hydrolase [Sediminicoccus sp. KRV36]|uniref:HAD family hydrolase n=1 Tax=Sediminicoccus sp. KRV36 TaxID=3133721 RepID=UPI0020107A05|nr:HAD family hydrolase [Sediminicoccus rosea]UPY35856.1 haloacid dehalogenase-like hydrolase [Sediminicoccus rosea]